MDGYSESSYSATPRFAAARLPWFIAEQNLMAAIELDERIGYSASSLAGQPYKGRNGRVEG
ncbi:type II toxin-antitoxin system RelE/ParE family toxin, partial [Escherichia coli]